MVLSVRSPHTWPPPAEMTPPPSSVGLRARTGAGSVCGAGSGCGSVCGAGSGCGSVCGAGSGCGSVCGAGSGCGSVCGAGSGCGSVCGAGSGCGSVCGAGSGCGSVCGAGSGCGSVCGAGSGCGSVCGAGSGSGSETGSGSSSGSGPGSGAGEGSSGCWVADLAFVVMSEVGSCPGSEVSSTLHAEAHRANAARHAKMRVGVAIGQTQVRRWKMEVIPTTATTVVSGSRAGCSPQDLQPLTACGFASPSVKPGSCSGLCKASSRHWSDQQGRCPRRCPEAVSHL